MRATVLVPGLLLAACGAVTQSGTIGDSGTIPPGQVSPTPAGSSSESFGSTGGSSSTVSGDDAGGSCSALSACCATLQGSGCSAVVASGSDAECATYLSGVQAAGGCVQPLGGGDAGPPVGDAWTPPPRDSGPVLGGDAAYTGDAYTGDAYTGDAIALDAPAPDSGAIASFELVVNGAKPSPLTCPSQAWQFPPAAGANPTVIIKNTGPVPIAYLTEALWYGGAVYTPDVATGTAGELVGVIQPGGEANISSVFAQNLDWGENLTIALLGSADPFTAPGGRTITDEGTIPWPAGVPGSGGAAQMQIAMLEWDTSCTPVNHIW